MTREAEKLLGGYATGTLTEAEKAVLFAAALEDQALFDALADEEVLRQLLADPEAKARLLQALAGRPAAQVVPAWRRPSVLGLAATLLLALGTTTLLWRGGPTPPPAPHPPEAAPARPLSVGTAAPAEPLRKAAPPRTSEAGAEEVVRKREAAPRPQPAPGLAPAERVHLLPSAPPEPRAIQDAPSAAAGVAFEAQASPSGTLPKARPTAEQAFAAESPRPAAAKSVASEDRMRTGPPSLFPHHTLQRVSGGLARLTVYWASSEHAVVLRRSPGGTSVIAPEAPPPETSGARKATYLFPLKEGDVIDLYLLQERPAKPETLPAQGPVPGTRFRVFPEDPIQY